MKTEYSYRFARVSPEDLFAQIVYSSEGNADLYKNIRTQDFSTEALQRQVDHYASWAAKEWKDRSVSAMPASKVSPPEGSATFKPTVFAMEPSYDALTQDIRQVVTEGDEVINISFEVIPIENVEMSKAMVRSERTERLSVTDYWMLSDTPEPTQAQLDYRQALRDVPQQDGFPQNIEWPTL